MSYISLIQSSQHISQQARGKCKENEPERRNENQRKPPADHLKANLHILLTFSSFARSVIGVTLPFKVFLILHSSYSANFSLDFWMLSQQTVWVSLCMLTYAYTRMFQSNVVLYSTIQPRLLEYHLTEHPTILKPFNQQRLPTVLPTSYTFWY